MEVEIDTYVEQPDGMRHTVNRAFFVMAAVDDRLRNRIQVPEPDHYHRSGKSPE